MSRTLTVVSMDLKSHLSSTQKGKVTESLAACTLMLASGGRLSPFLPLSDDHGIDLIVFDKETQRSIAIQVKSAIANLGRGTVQFDVRKATLSNCPDRYLLAVLFDPDEIRLAASWLIPMARLPEVSIDQADKYAISPSPAPTSKDRYLQFRMLDAKTLATAMVAAINGVPAPAAS